MRIAKNNYGYIIRRGKRRYYVCKLETVNGEINEIYKSFS
ncbi:putative integrase [Sulfurisphaera tokodaii]|nr:putative integrase [Sulfurisphaera tokodaii]